MGITTTMHFKGWLTKVLGTSTTTKEKFKEMTEHE